MTVHARAVEGALDVQEPPEPALLQHAADLLERRLVAPVESHREHASGLGARAHRSLRARLRQRERLLREDVLAGARRRDDLLGMLGVRRRQDDRVDAGIGERRSVVTGEGQAVPGRERAGLVGGARDAGREADPVGLALRAFDQVLAPAAEADDGGSDHSGFSLVRVSGWQSPGARWITSKLRAQRSIAFARIGVRK